jgi:hypothetical protein
MKRAVLGLLAALILVLFASTGSAQMKSEKQETRWEGTIICSDRVGKGPLQVNLYEDSTCAVYWKTECLGLTVVSSPVKGTYNLNGETFSAIVKGFARTHHGPSSYYEGRFYGKLGESTGNGTYEMTFFEEDLTGRGWPPEDKGTWEVIKVK